MRIVTKRLILRTPALKDAKDIAANANDLEVSRYLARVPYPYSVENARHFIKFRQKLTKENPYSFGITLKKTGKIIGMTGFIRIDDSNKKAELGYWLGRKHWRQGIMEEALRGIIKFTFNKLKMNRLEAGVAKENKASANLLKKVGFVKEGMKRMSMRSRATGKWHDTYFFGLLKSDLKK